jgi:uncharacterized coiled-coil protein SlyX
MYQDCTPNELRRVGKKFNNVSLHNTLHEDNTAMCDDAARMIETQAELLTQMKKKENENANEHSALYKKIKELQDEKEEGPDMVQQPPHYCARDMECIDEIKIAFGLQVAFDFCIANAWKYRYRAGLKDDVRLDNAKSEQYMRMAEEIKEEMGC